MKRLRSFLLIYVFLVVSLVFPPPSSAYYTNMSASVVVGQKDFTSNSANQGGSVGANTLKAAYQMIMVGSKLVVTDENNHRLLIFNSLPTTNNAAADVVIGQPDFVSSSANQGSANPTANTLNIPTDLSTDGTKLFVADNSNHRILIYNRLPTSNNASADIVIGQTTMNTKTSGLTASTLNQPVGVFFDVSTTKLFISDSINNRVLIYNQVPTTNGASADVVIGQANFTGGSANQGGSVGANTYDGPRKLNSDLRLYITMNHGSKHTAGSPASI